MGLFGKNPLFEVVSNPDIGWYPEMIMNILGDELKDPQPIELPLIHRTNQNLTWKQRGRLWAIEEDGVRKYGGYTRYAAGIVKGEEAKPLLGDFDSLETPDFIEIIN